MRLSDLPHIDQLAFLNEVRSRLAVAPTRQELRWETPTEMIERSTAEAEIMADLMLERGLDG